MHDLDKLTHLIVERPKTLEEKFHKFTLSVWRPMAETHLKRHKYIGWTSSGKLDIRTQF